MAKAETMGFTLFYAVTEFIRSSGLSVYKRLNLATIIGAIASGQVPASKDLVVCMENLRLLRERYSPVLDSDAYVSEEKATFEIYLYEAFATLIQIIHKEKLIDTRTMSVQLAERFGQEETDA